MAIAFPKVIGYNSTELSVGRQYYLMDEGTDRSALSLRHPSFDPLLPLSKHEKISVERFYLQAMQSGDDGRLAGSRPVICLQ